MKRSTIILLSVIAVLVIFVAGAISQYNKLVGLDEGVSAQWANVENQYQRRADLIPNLVATVRGYASHERETLEGVIEARSKATQVNIDPSNMTQSQLNQFQAAQGELSSALSRLMVVVERYPDLKANQNFRDLQVSLKAQKTGLQTRELSSTARRIVLTLLSVASLPICWPVCLGSSEKPISKRKEVVNKHLLLSFN